MMLFFTSKSAEKTIERNKTGRDSWNEMGTVGMKWGQMEWNGDRWNGMGRVEWNGPNGSEWGHTVGVKKSFPFYPYNGCPLGERVLNGN